ncbi:MAG: M1 family peptidase, partial [Pedobacter sp.]
DKQVSYRWQADVPGFDMPVRIKKTKKTEWIYPGSEWKKIRLKGSFEPDTDNFYILTKEIQ